MNYKQIYDRFIDSRRDQCMLSNVIYENHHIIPRSMGGTDDVQNMIKLTTREHFFAHRLLAKFAGPKMKIALTWFINGTNVAKCGAVPSSRTVAAIREAANESRSVALTGRTFTDEHRFNLSQAKKGKPTWNAGLTVEDPRVAENVRKTTAAKRNNPKPAWNKGLTGEEYKAHYNTGLTPPSMVGRIWINDGIAQRKILNTEPIPDGWHRGRCDNKGDNNPMRKQK